MNEFCFTYYKIVCLCFIQLLLCSISTAQEVTVSEVIAPLHKANFDINYGDQLNFLQNQNQNIPIVDKLEFRTETDENNFERQEYLFRTSFNSFPTRKVQRKITSNSVAFYQLRDQILAEDLLEKQYEEIITLHYDQIEFNLVEEELVIAKDRLVVLKKMVTTAEEIELVDILKIEKDIMELERDKLRLTNSISNSIKIVLDHSKIATDVGINTMDWLSLEDMSSNIISSTNENIPSTEQQLQANRIEEAELAYAFENAERKRILDFVQIKYAGRETALIKNEVSFGAGINIPTRSSERQRMNERQVDILDEQFKAELLDFEISSDIDELLIDFRNIQSQYELVLSQQQNQKLNETLNSYIQSGLAQPLSLLRIKESILDYKKALFNLEKDACNIYFNTLVAQGKINILSNVNYLSRGLKTF